MTDGGAEVDFGGIMSQCIKTGAYVYFSEYEAFSPADIFEHGDCIIIQWMPEGWVYEAERPPTHAVIIGHGYHHRQRGITVVRKEFFNTLLKD